MGCCLGQPSASGITSSTKLLESGIPLMRNISTRRERSSWPWGTVLHWPFIHLHQTLTSDARRCCSTTTTSSQQACNRCSLLQRGTKWASRDPSLPRPPKPPNGPLQASMVVPWWAPSDHPQNRTRRGGVKSWAVRPQSTQVVTHVIPSPSSRCLPQGDSVTR